MSHTPGPWEAVLDEDPRGQPTGMYRGLVAICEKGERYLAVVAACGEVDRSQWVDNCRLIAAAPDLLAACERALDLLGVIEDQYRCGDTRTTAILRAGIAKARGE